MSRPITLTLESIDVLQLLDALENRAVAYEKTAALFMGEGVLLTEGEDALDGLFVPEECRDAAEAKEIARHFREIIEKIDEQFGEAKQEI